MFSLTSLAGNLPQKLPSTPFVKQATGHYIHPSKLSHHRINWTQEDSCRFIFIWNAKTVATKIKDRTAVLRICQMKILMKSQTMLKRGQKKPNRLLKSQKKSQTLFAVLLFLVDNEAPKLRTRISLEIFFEIEIKSCLALYLILLLMLLWLFVVCEIANFGCSGATVWTLILYIGSFLHSCESYLPFAPVRTGRIIRALPLYLRYCRISIAETQTCLQALSQLSAHNTLHSAQISSDYEKNHFECSIPEILTTSERGRRSNIAFITKILRGKFFSVKRPKKVKRPNKFFRANQLEMWPNKGQKDK